MLVTALMNALAVLTAVLALLATATTALVLDAGACISLPHTGECLGAIQAGAGVSQLLHSSQTSRIRSLARQTRSPVSWLQPSHLRQEQKPPPREIRARRRFRWAAPLGLVEEVPPS